MKGIMNDEELDALLRSDQPVADEGFTNRVVEQLPPARRRAPRFAILLGATTLGSAIAWFAAPNALPSLVSGMREASSVTPFLVAAAILTVLVGAVTQEARATT